MYLNTFQQAMLICDMIIENLSQESNSCLCIPNLEYAELRVKAPIKLWFRC